MISRHAWFVLSLVALTGAAAHSPPPTYSYPVNGDFSQGIEGWTLAQGAGDAELSWDPADGSPEPGSLRVQWVGAPSPSRHLVLSPCLQMPAGDPGTWSFEVMGDRGEETPELACQLEFRVYSDPSCQDLVLELQNPIPIPLPFPQDWESHSFEVGLGVPGGWGFPLVSIQAVLSASGGQSGQTQDCAIDSVEILGPPPTQPIPTAEVWGLGVFGLMLVVLAVWRLRAARSPA